MEAPSRVVQETATLNSQPPLTRVGFITIENVVASANLGVRIDLKALKRAIPKLEIVHVVESNVDAYAGVYRVDDPKSATLIFQSGKMVCTGAKSTKDAETVVGTIKNEFDEKGIKVMKTPDVQIQNVVASAGLGGYIDLEKATNSLKRIMYEPEQFPGVIYRMDDPKVVILLFASGKLVCTGAKKESEVHRAITKLQDTLEEKTLITYRQAEAVP